MSHTPTSCSPLSARCQGWLRRLWVLRDKANHSVLSRSGPPQPGWVRQVQRLVAGLLLGAVTTAAQADWTFLAVKDGVTYLVDRNTIATAGPYKRIWMLQNYPLPYSQGAQSLAMLMEVECPKYRLRFNQLVAHAGQHLSGTQIDTITQPGPWETVAPGPFRSVYDLLCRTHDPRLDPQPPQPAPPAKR